jgi:hypothetical protein
MQLRTIHPYRDIRGKPMTRIVDINANRVRPVDPGAAEGLITVQCCVCSKMGATLADLDGEPFKSYYHAACLPPAPHRCMCGVEIPHSADMCGECFDTLYPQAPRERFEP